MTYQQLWHQLTPLYAIEEAQAITRLVLETTFGFSLTDLVCGKVSELSADDETKLHEIWQRLEAGEPVQYVLGEADFYGRSFHVAPGVLIPRPETEGLCRLVLDGLPTGAHVLDIGTGSGCIAITIALEATQALVEAWDISAEALRQARDNAFRLGTQVLFRQNDVLAEARKDVLTEARGNVLSETKENVFAEARKGEESEEANRRQRSSCPMTIRCDSTVPSPSWGCDDCDRKAVSVSKSTHFTPRLSAVCWSLWAMKR